MDRRTNPKLEIGDYSYSKPATKSLNVPKIFRSINKNSMPSPVLANKTTWIKTPSSSPKRNPSKKSSPKPRKPNHYPSILPPPPTSPDNVAQVVQIATLVVEEVKANDIHRPFNEATVEVEKLQ